jgi:hypothetical protein
MSTLHLAPTPPECNHPIVGNDGWRYVLRAFFADTKVTVRAFGKKSDAKALRNQLRSRFPEIEFAILYDPPRPRWRQMKAAALRLRAEQTTE